jgi:hypothetical protein
MPSHATLLELFPLPQRQRLLRPTGGLFIGSPKQLAVARKSSSLIPAPISTIGTLGKRRFGVGPFALDQFFEAGHEGAISAMGL